MRLSRLIFSVCLLLGLNDALQAQQLESYLQARVEQLRETTQQELAEVTSANWQANREQWRGELREMLGIPDDLKKTPLKMQKVGVIDCGEVTVHRLHYQARPGLYVGANLYVPKEAAPPEGFPAVLYVCGHARATSGGRLLGNKTSYQHHGL